MTDYSESQCQALPHGSSHDYSFPVQQGNYHTTEHGVADTHKVNQFTYVSSQIVEQVFIFKC